MTKVPHNSDQSKLTHMNQAGHASMVDVSDKPVTHRGAIAQGRVQISQELADRINANTIAKGNLIDVARLAGIMGAKKTGDLIPLCHPLGLDSVAVDIELIDTTMHIRASAKCCGRTGIEMEALTAVSIAALTIIDMGKAVDKSMVIEGIQLIEKWGGRSGHYLTPGHNQSHCGEHE
ncbi:MAG: cyclic pyranopterin monophosphate synthase MoaC [Phycisphaerales bacterium]